MYVVMYVYVCARVCEASCNMLTSYIHENWIPKGYLFKIYTALKSNKITVME